MNHKDRFLAEERIEHYVYRFTDLPKLIYSRPSANETSGEQKYVIVQLDDIALHHVNVSVLSNHLQLNLFTTNEKNSRITALYWDNPLHRINELIIDGVTIQGLEKFELTEIQHIEKAIYHALFRELVARQQKEINLSTEIIADLKFLLILQAQAEKPATVNFYKHLDFATQADLNQFIQIYKNTYPDDATILRRLGQLFAGESGVKQTTYLLWQIAKASTMNVSEIDLKAYFSLINEEEIAFLFQAVRVTNKLPLTLVESLQHSIDHKKDKTLIQIIRQLMNWQKENQRLISTSRVEQDGYNLPAHYQSYRLTAETSAVIQPLPSQEADHSASLLSWTSIGLAIGGGALITGGIGFLFIIRRMKRAYRQSGIGLAEAATVALLAGVRQARAEVLNNTFEKGACHQLANHWAGLCVGNAKDAALVWWKERQGVDWVTLSSQTDHPIHDAKVLTVNDSNITIQYASGYNQPLVLQNLPAELNKKFVLLVHTLSSDKACWQFTDQQWAWFQHQLCQTFGYMLGSHALLHTHCGDILQKLGLRIDWRTQEESRLLQSWLMTFSHLFAPSIFPTSPISSVGAALLETGLAHHEIQSRMMCLFGRYTPQAKGIVHIWTNFLQFGCSLWMLANSVLPFILRKSPELAMVLSWSLRLAYSYYSQADWSGFYYCVGLLVLPQLPIVLETIGIPATRYLDKLVNGLSQLFLMESLVRAMELEADNNRVVQSEQTWKETNVRVDQGKQRVQRWCSAASFFSELLRLQPIMMNNL